MINEKLRWLKLNVPVNEAEKLPDPVTGTIIKDLSDNDKSRIIYLMAVKMGQADAVIRTIAQDLILLTCPIPDGLQ